MRDLFFGGSFNPIHLGHLITARAVALAGSFDRVVLIPAAVSPHKLSEEDLAPAPARLAMCHLAAKSAAAGGMFAVDGLEIDRPAPSFTIETVRALRRRGVDSVSWLIGADQVPNLPFWHDANALLHETQFVIMARPGFELDFDALPKPFRRLRDAVIEIPLVDVSATEVRRRVRLGLDLTKFVPPEVADYIHEQRLYTQPAVEPA